MTAARKPQSQGSRELMHEMSIWATQHRPKLILTEYMRRLVLAQPPDPPRIPEERDPDEPRRARALQY